MLSLTVEKGEPAGTVFELKPGESTLGRSRSATIRLLSQDISGLHARVLNENGVARLENLSQFGTRIDHAPVTGSAALSPGQRIEIGKATVLLVRDAGGDEAPTGGGEVPPAASGAGRPPQEGVTGVSPSAGATRAATGAAVTGGAGESDDLSELTRSMSNTSFGSEGDGAEGATRAMQTRAATPEEIDHLKETERKRARKRMTIGLSAGFAGVVLVLVFRPRTPPPENEIEWTMDAAGEYVDLFEAAPGGGVKDGGFDLCYPGNDTFKKKSVEGGMILEGRIARNLDVPMRMILQEEQEVRFAAMTREQAVEDWMQQISGSGGRWNFDRPSPTPSFFGKKNGVPYTRVTYLRDDNGTWFGVASVVRHGCRRIVARAEVPAAERVRAEKMMSAKLILPSSEFEYSFWEGVPVTAKLDEDEVLRQIHADLERMAPATWVALETLLQSLLSQAVQAGHKEIETEAVRQLVKLRERQALWFNSQKLAFDAAMMQNNWKKAEKIGEFTKAVFSNIEDQRYFDVRKWKAEP